MKVTLNWLRELVETTLSASELAEVLTAGGLEVEGIEEQHPRWRSVEIAEVLEVQPHPNADRLRACSVRTARGTVSIVCGASNMRAGDKVALAVPGTDLPGGRRIERSTIRGLPSEGMLCAAEELGLEATEDGIMILPPAAPIGTPLVDYLGADDTVLELGITPNRGDCLSVLGVAREVAALTGVRLRPWKSAVREDGPAVRTLARVDVEAPDLCPRYCARVVRGVTIAPSPPWLRTRLALVGLRPINNVVDATNYVMIERGQPLHAFDHARLGDRRIVVRRAGAAVRFATLDGASHELIADDLVIADGHGPVALAGIMGGANSEIRDDTADVLLESAFFDPRSVRRTARRLGLITDSSYRFERGVDPGSTGHALDRVAELLTASAGGVVARGLLERRTRVRWTGAPIRVRPARVNQILGTDLKPEQMKRALRAVGGQVTAAAGKGTFRVVPPSHRFDLQTEIDLVEEVARLGGYESVAPTIPAVASGSAPRGGLRDLELTVREALRATGLNEMVTLSMVGAADNRTFPGLMEAGVGTVGLANPMSSETGEMRRSLLPGLLHALAENRRQGEVVVAGFTCGRVYGRRAEAYVEQTHAGVLVAGTWPAAAIGEAASAVTFADVKGRLEALLAAVHVGNARWEAVGEDARYLHPGKAARIVVAGQSIGVAGALHPDLIESGGLDVEPWVAELDLQKVLNYCPRRVIFRPLPRFPAVQRDVAVIVDSGFQSQQVLDAIGEVAQPLVEEVRVFDQYTGDPIPAGKKSLAYSVSYRAPDRTLTDDEVNALHEELVGHLVRRLSVEVRR